MVYKALMKSLQIRFILRHMALYNSLCEQYDRGMDPLIEVQNLTKRYGNTIAVDHLTMTILSILRSTPSFPAETVHCL